MWNIDQVFTNIVFPFMVCFTIAGALILWGKAYNTIHEKYNTKPIIKNDYEGVRVNKYGNKRKYNK